MHTKTKDSIKLYFKKYRPLQVISGIFMAISLFLGLVIIIQMQKIMDLLVLVLSEGTAQIYDVAGQTKILMLVIACYLIIMFISQICFRRLNFLSGFGLSLKMILNTFKLPSNKIKGLSSGDLSNRIFKDSEYISNWHASGKVTLLIEIIWLLVTLAVMIMYSVWITLMVIITIIIGIKISEIIQKKIANTTKNYQELNAVTNGDLIEYLQGREDIRAFNAVDFFYGKLKDLILNKQAKVMKIMSFQYALYLVVNAFLAYALPGIVVISGVFFTLRGELTLGSILALYALTQQIQEPIRMITEMNQQKEISKQMEKRNSFILTDSEEEGDYVEEPLEEANLFIKTFIMMKNIH